MAVQKVKADFTDLSQMIKKGLVMNINSYTCIARPLSHGP